MKLSLKLVKELDRVFSIYIRQKYADMYGFTECYTCGTKLYWSELQCGHYYSRKYYSTRWDEDNCRPQCYKCNMLLRGNLNAYTKNLFLELGEQKYNELTENSKTFYKLDVKELEKKIKHYKVAILI